MMTLTYQYKLKPTRQQEIDINHILDVCKSVYNYALRERKDWCVSRKSPISSCSILTEYIIPANAPYPNYHNQAKSLTIAKKTNPKLKSLNAQVLQQTLKTLERGFSQMKSLGKGFPRFKKRMRSFVFPAMLKNCLGCSRFNLPQLGWIKLRQSRPYPEGMEAKQARIVKKTSGYYLMITFASSESVPDNPVGNKYYAKVDKNYTSQECPKCGQIEKKKLSDRKHICSSCGDQTNCDVAAAKVIRNRGLIAVGHTVEEKACGDGLTGLQFNLFDLLSS
ncbi:MAG: helix-turn-helix domain-containing protein [Okeania sp. SIO1H6]|uniref:Transposase n=2 Tax=Microcoleaceae TaxID=1892252 RepID=A0A3N6P490_9CYAN|nr:helix-turn-helix domain-containing protein [Okeania sp. SIO1H4]NET12711.1 helix-turn-helix domain-containing protein [Okeania sp. SIO1H6]NET21595.1 helix-turn-helix domain-containing protein [Okeania sp. SIO1H5]NET77502.1 helix-turn-helix domain-containing protein [Okeania sp. SIO1F9]NET91685.1 helix-turn-helix domain-containing protein [Okeania sp. SIO1H2]RQH17020.1 hypothetical protein D4Z78_18480 [Okeania hirsuta]